MTLAFVTKPREFNFRGARLAATVKSTLRRHRDRSREFSLRSDADVRAALSSGGGWLVASSHGTVRCWSVAKGRQIGEFHVQGTITAVAVSPYGRYVAASAGGRVLVWLSESGRDLCRVVTASALTCLSLGSGCALAGSAGGEFSFWELQTGAMIVAVRPVTEPLVSVALAPGRQHYNGGWYLAARAASRRSRLRQRSVSEGAFL